MASRPTTEELEVFEFVRTAEAGEMTVTKIAEHFRGKKTSTRVINLLDALYQKGWLFKRWPNWFIVNVKAVAELEGGRTS